VAETVAVSELSTRSDARKSKRGATPGRAPRRPDDGGLGAPRRATRPRRHARGASAHTVRAGGATGRTESRDGPRGAPPGVPGRRRYAGYLPVTKSTSCATSASWLRTSQWFRSPWEMTPRTFPSSTIGMWRMRRSETTRIAS